MTRLLNTRSLIFLLLLWVSGSTWAADTPSSAYATILEYVEAVFGVDPNEGLTTFLSQLVPMGGKAEAMGTAFTAIADDPSFLDWNPAGSATQKYTELAVFHNNWIADTRVEGLVYTWRKEDLGLSIGGKWLYLPFTEYDTFGNRVSKGYYAETTAIVNASYNFLRGYYFNGVSVGASARAAYRSVPDYGDESGTLVSGSGSTQSAVAAMIDLGALTRFNLAKFYNAREKNTAVALTLRNFGPPVLDEPLPTLATLGLAYKPMRPLQLAFDFSLPINLVSLEESENPYWSFGAALQATQFLSTRMGFSIKGSNPRFSLGSGIKLRNVNLDINYTLDLTTRLQPFNRVSLTARFDFGDQGRAKRAAKVDELYLKGLEAYAAGNFEETIRLWDEALSLDAGFDPAREGKTAIMAAQDLEQRIIDIQKLE